MTTTTSPAFGTSATPVAARLVAPDQRRLAARYRRQTTARRLRSGAVTASGWTSVAVAISLYLSFGGAARFTSPAHAVKELGILAGIVATDLTVLMFLTSARIPFVDAAIGHDRALAIHRKLGAGTILGLLAHGVLLVLGYGMTAGIGPIEMFFDMLSVQEILLAVLGMVGLGLVGLSSFQAARRAMGFGVWQAIHALTYASVALSIPHQFTEGVLSDPSPQQYYWIALLSLTGLAVLVFRFVVPAVQSWRRSLKVTDVRTAGPDAVSTTMTGSGVHRLGAAAGQFFEFRFLGKGLWWHAHPFSLSAAPTGSTLRITVRNLGDGTSRLQQVGPGTRVMVEGPYGLFSDHTRSTTDGLVLAGAGIGIAPIRALLEETAAVPGATTVILRASRPEELYLVDEVEALCRAKGAELVLAVGHRGDGAPAWLPGTWEGSTLAGLAPQVARADVYACGPEAWTQAFVTDAVAAGAAPTRIHQEKFSW